jgi:hypothetical protein
VAEAVIWRSFHHPNVLPFYGIYRWNNQLALVSPWMENGNVIRYLQTSPHADRASLVRCPALPSTLLMVLHRLLMLPKGSSTCTHSRLPTLISKGYPSCICSHVYGSLMSSLGKYPRYGLAPGMSRRFRFVEIDPQHTPPNVQHSRRGQQRRRHTSFYGTRAFSRPTRRDRIGSNLPPRK